MSNHVEQGLVVLDRSTLEHWANCPAQAGYILQGVADGAGLDASSGNEVHTAVSSTIEAYIASFGSMETSDIREFLMDAIASARPDVQPDAIDATRPFSWDFAKLLKSIEPEFIYAFDGGAGDRSSQLAWDFTEIGCRVTSELDFLYAGQSEQVAKLIDWKSGRTKYWEEAVAESFQFGMHAWLAFNHFPQVERLDVAIWETRINHRSAPVSFRRRDMADLGRRVYSAAQNWHKWNAEAAPAWPAPEKCRLCPAILKCAKASQEVADIQADPHGQIAWAVLAQLAIDKIAETLGAQIRETGRDIVTPEGFSLGTMRPKTKQKAKVEFYTQKTAAE